jgi:predicted Zn finger-like uncharacterized protein
MRDKFVNFMMGRYGTDTLNKHLMIALLALIVLNIFFNSRVIYIVSYVIIFVDLFRTFSKNINARYKENEAYENFIGNIRGFFVLQNKQIHDREHKYFRCKNCHQIIRVPKGKGKIEVRCPKCGTTFDAKS